MIFIKQNTRLVIVISFFISSIIYGYQVYENRSGFSYEVAHPRSKIKSEYEIGAIERARGEVVSENFEYRFCDKVMNVDYITSRAVRVTCIKSLPSNMLWLTPYFALPFIFISLFGFSISWAIRTKGI